MEVGSEKLKALDAFRLKMGGTLQQRVKRLFLTKTIARIKDNTMKKQALTCEEIEAEREDEEAQTDTESGTMRSRFIAPRSCPWVGMGNLYLIGSISFMGLVKNSSVRYVGTTVIGTIGLMSGILRNGTISMVCVALAFQTPKTSTRSLQLRKLRNCGIKFKRGKD